MKFIVHDSLIIVMEFKFIIGYVFIKIMNIHIFRVFFSCFLCTIYDLRDTWVEVTDSTNSTNLSSLECMVHVMREKFLYRVMNTVQG